MIGGKPTRSHPTLVGQQFEVPADGGLRQLEDIAQIDHAQLVVFKKVKQSQSGGICQAVDPGQQGNGLRRAGTCSSVYPDELLQDVPKPVKPGIIKPESSSPNDQECASLQTDAIQRAKGVPAGGRFGALIAVSRG